MVTMALVEAAAARGLEPLTPCRFQSLEGDRMGLAIGKAVLDGFQRPLQVLGMPDKRVRKAP
jgi:hypothetical protein